jgi:class 3 adenylate cyclase
MTTTSGPPTSSAPPTPTSAELQAELQELRQLREVSRALDELLEEGLKEREPLVRTFQRVLPALLALCGARGAAVTTRNEELAEQTFHAGDFGGVFPGHLLAHPYGVRREGPGTLVSQALDVAGQAVGSIGLFWEGDRTEPAAAARLSRLVDAVAEQLDTVLVLVHTAREKHQVTLELNRQLSNPVFEAGMDRAVLALAQRVSLPGFLLVYRDAVRTGQLHYRTYRHGHLQHESGEQPWPALERAVEAHGAELLAPGDARLREALGEPRVVEAVLISGYAHSEPLGKLLVWGEEGYSAFALDLLRLLSSTLSQRLIDYNRERIHLSQFFPAGTIDELLKDPAYATRYLSSRDEQVGILFADINGFTRLCEQGLESPTRIGRFVDAWSDRVVELLWRHGGVFDKMVGDCVIGLFGPPFFRSSRLERVESLVRAACDIQAYTASLSADPEVQAICQKVGLPGLGVAVGLNLAHAYCGLFGPNQNYTGFSTGMNQTARLQSLGGFRETLVMEPVRETLRGTQDPRLQALGFGELTETPVKNVAQPLRYFHLTGGGGA